jgi:hypothetical protein
MKSFSMRSPATFLALGALALLLTAGAALGASPHDFAAGDCPDCHRDIDGEKKAGRADLLDDVDQRCIDCHPACRQGKKHTGSPGTPSSMKAPFPIDRAGKITCHTCHDPHLPFDDPKIKGKTAFLRVDNRKRELCYNCHWVGKK